MHPTLTASKRIVSIDVLRGLVMVIMALDHTRDFFSNVSFNPLDLSQTSPQLFLTRWITHFCAPVFVFLSGCSIYLTMQRGKTKSQQSGFLLKRGLWLIFVEIAIINFAFSFDPNYTFIGLQVIWAIGFSMIALAALVYLKPIYVGIIGLFIIFLHNSLDSIGSDSFGNWKAVWMMLHEQNVVPYGNGRILGFFYPVLPWIGIMAAGYGFGWFFTIEREKRSRWFMLIGWGSILLFIAIRFTNSYGNFDKWQQYDVWWKTVLSFIDCKKYPPSLLYVLMTLGPAILLLNVFESISNRFTKMLNVYGSVPFFYYVLHFYIIHLSQVVIAKFMGISVGNPFGPNPGWGFRLLIVYLVWIAVVASLYYPCKWFMGVKKRRKDWWLSYL